MSVSLAAPETIRKHPINSSPSKQMHSFPRDERFKGPNPECPTHFYDQEYLSNRAHEIKSNMSKASNSNKGASFGYGTKYDFTKTMPNWRKEALKEPQQRSFLEMSKAKGKSMGKSGESMPNNSYLIPQLQKVPGPGQYEGEKQKKGNIAYSFRVKPMDVIEQHLSYKNERMGPGAHHRSDMQLTTGFKILAKYSNTRNSKIHSASERFPGIKKISPGPGMYLEGDSLVGDGKYTLSTHRSNGRRQFSKGLRHLYDNKNSTISPGPGSYTEVSDFGQYGVGLQTRKYTQLRKGSRLNRDNIPKE